MNKKAMRILSVLLFGALILPLTACSGETNSSENSSENFSEEIQAADASAEGTATEGGDEASEALTATVTVNADTSSLAEASEISDTLYGLFLEDINFAVDGGLYAELIKNRSFEYGTSAANANYHGWTATSDAGVTFTVVDGAEDGSYLNEANTHYAVVENNGEGRYDYEGIANVGYLDGLAVTAGETYNVSFYIKGNYSGDVRIALQDSDTSAVYAESTVSGVTNEWQKMETTLTPNETVNDNLRLHIEITEGTVNLDMVSLMPADTYAGLPIRKDIGEALEALNPSFLRFPGGCVIEGKDEESMYSWKDSIGNGATFTINGTETTGDVAVRPQGKDIWTGSGGDPYYTSYGLGFYEYFELCEALDCLALPVLNAGMTCPVQSSNYVVYALASDEFKQCIQDALDLVEFCRGGADTYWGSVRIAMGHEEPFELKYIAIGNEQWASDYHAHFKAFVEAFAEAAEENPELYGDIELVVANGTTSSATAGWDYVELYPDDTTTLVDEHYYNEPAWFLSNTDRYDGYDRANQAKVFLGEYAAQSNTLLAALSEAAYMTGLEENGDVVQMACYAPLFGNSKTNQWTPDMMFFSNDSLMLSVNYYVQQLYSENKGTNVLETELSFSDASFAESGTGVLSDDGTSGFYRTASVDENGDLILKFVNTCENAVDVTVELDGFDVSGYETEATVTTLGGESLKDSNSFEEPDVLVPAETTTEVSENFTMEVPKYALCIVRIPAK